MENRSWSEANAVVAAREEARARVSQVGWSGVAAALTIAAALLIERVAAAAAARERGRRRRGWRRRWR